MPHIKPRTQTIPIYQGDDLQRIIELRQQATIAEIHAQERLNEAERFAKSEAPRAGDDGMAVARSEFEAAIKPARDAYDEFVQESATRACMVEVHEIGSRRFRDLRLKHEARMVEVYPDPLDVDVDVDDDAPAAPAQPEMRVHEDDDLFGVNTETFPRALLTYIDEEHPEKRTIVEPEFSTVQDVEAFLDDEIGEGDLEKMWLTAWHLNRRVSADPKASLYSPERPTSSETST